MRVDGRDRVRGCNRRPRSRDRESIGTRWSSTMRDGRAAMDELAHPVVVEFPLRGEWLVERTPSSRIPSHGTDALGQRFAYDFVRTDHRAGTSPAPGEKRALVPDRWAHARLLRMGTIGPCGLRWPGHGRRGWRTGASVGECRTRIVVCAEERVGLPARQARPRSPRREPRDHPERRGVCPLRASRVGQHHRDGWTVPPRRRGDRSRRPYGKLDRSASALPT